MRRTPTLPLLAIALLAACATQRAAQPDAVANTGPGIFQAAEMARVRCLLVAPFENASDQPLAAEAATSAVLSGVSASGTRIFPVKELRGLFTDTAVELPEGIPPGLAMELAQLVGADAAIYGTVEGSAISAGTDDSGLVVSVRLSLSPRRELLYASTFAVRPRKGEGVEGAVRRSLAEATHGMFLRLGGFRGGTCFDRKRLDSLRALAVTEAAARSAPPPGPVATAAPTTPPATATPAPPAPPPVVAQPTTATTVTAATPARPSAAARPVTITPRQKEWAQQLAGREQFLLDDVAFAGRTPQLQRDSGLADLAVVLLSAPELRVKLEGHVDATHDAAADARLSMDMAKAAADRLADLGVPAGRVQIAGRGAENPRLPNFTARGRAANRRIEALGLK